MRHWRTLLAFGLTVWQGSSSKGRGQGASFPGAADADRQPLAPPHEDRVRPDRKGSQLLFRRVALLVSLLVPLALVTSPVATASTESDFVSRTNGARASRGLPSYAVSYDLISVARRQAARMAAAHRLYHNPNLGSEVGNWSALAENVGRGGDVASIQSAFMNSPEHRANILSTRYTQVGIGTARGSDGQIYVSEVFRRPLHVTYIPPAPRRTTRTSTRASRSAPRTAPAVKPPARALAVIDPWSPRLAAAWRMYRRSRPVDPFERVIVYLRTSRYVATYATR